MRKNLKARKLAKRILALCRDGEGRIAPERVGEALGALRANPPRQHGAVLRYLAVLAAREIAATTARVVSGTDLAEESLQKIEAGFSRKYDRPLAVESRTDPALLAGTRVQVGDDVYEISIPARLARLETNRSG